MASDLTALQERLKAMAAEWDDPMCSENPVHPLLLEAASEIDRLQTENDLLAAEMSAQDLHSCEHNGCALSDEGRDSYRTKAKDWVERYWAMRRRLIELGEPVL